jgi:hypothetical protein
MTNIDREYVISKASGGAGGAGGHVSMFKDVAPLTTYLFTVGKGGLTASSNIVKGMANSTGSISWFDANNNLITEPSILVASSGQNGGNSSFGGNLIAYGGRSGVGATVQINNGLPGKGGWGSAGGSTPSTRTTEIYGGNNGGDGQFIIEGPKGPGQAGASYGFNESAVGGICKVPGAGSGGDGQKTYDTTLSANNGQDGRVRIEW